MILWCDGAHDAPENMRRDRALLEAAEERAGCGEPVEPLLRLFRFSPFAVTLGHAQDPARELDLERCRRDGVAWAVRPTGGRAIFHAEEWTYSFTAAISDPQWGGSLGEAYDRLARVLHASLLRLAVPAELALGAARESCEDSWDREGPAPPCFASTARHEIVRDGLKLVGSAQRRTAHALLQQGSVLLGNGHLRLADYLALPEAKRASVRAALARSSRPAGDVLGSGAPLARWADALSAVLGPGVRTTTDAAPAFPLLAPKSALYTRPAV